jgi:hypothetical protein
MNWNKGNIFTAVLLPNIEAESRRCTELLLYTKTETPFVPVLSSERASHGMKNVTVRRIPYSVFLTEKISGHKPQMWLDTKTYWLTDWPSVAMWLWLWLDFDLSATESNGNTAEENGNEACPSDLWSGLISSSAIIDCDYERL